MTPRAPAGGLEKFKGGQFLPKALWEAQKASAKAQLPQETLELSKSVEFLMSVAETLGMVPAGVPVRLTFEQIEDQLIRQLRGAYNRAFLLGKRSSGNLTDITDDDRKALTKIRRDEYKYARNFLRSSHQQKGRLEISVRSAMYGNALREAYWLGFVLGNTEATRSLVWRTGETEHCTHCLGFSEHGPYPVKQFLEEVLGKGFLPQSGNLECIGVNCRCYLEEV